MGAIMGKYRKIDEKKEYYFEFVEKLPNVPSFGKFKEMSKAERKAYIRNETINYVLNEN